MTPEEPRPPTRGTPGAPGEDVVSDDDEAYQRGWNIADAQILEHDRAALLAKLAYEDRPPLGRRPVPWTPVHRREWTDWARRILDRLLPLSSQPAPDAGLRRAAEWLVSIHADDVTIPEGSALWEDLQSLKAALAVPR